MKQDRRQNRKPTQQGVRAKRAVRGVAASQTRRERVASKEGAIITVATDMFAARGFAKTTISEIAQEAGVAEGTVYLYFTNKDALARAVLANFYRRLTEKALTGVARYEATDKRLAFLARHHLDSIIKSRAILELITVTDRDSESYEGGDLYKMNKEYVAVFDGVIREGLWRGDVHKGYSLWILRDFFFGGLEYAMRTTLIKNRRKNIGQVVSQLVRMIAPISERSGPVAKAQTITSGDLAKVAVRIENAAARLEQMIDRQAPASKRKSSL